MKIGVGIGNVGRIIEVPDLRGKYKQLDLAEGTWDNDICKNCNEVRGDHASENHGDHNTFKCLFGSTQFEQAFAVVGGEKTPLRRPIDWMRPIKGVSR